MQSDPIGPPDIDLQGKQPELTDTQMLAVIHHMTLMLSDFGKHEPECFCSIEQPAHAVDCGDCECGLADAIKFGIEWGGPIEPEPMTPEEEARLHEIGIRAVEKALQDERAKHAEPGDSEMLDWLIPRVISTQVGAFIKDRAALRGLMREDAQ